MMEKGRKEEERKRKGRGFRHHRGQMFWKYGSFLERTGEEQGKFTE